MKAIARRLTGAAKKVPGAAMKLPRVIGKGVQGIPRAPKVLAQKRLSQRVLAQLRLFPENERRLIKTYLHLPGRRTYAVRDSLGNFYIELRDSNNELVEERRFNSEGMLTQLAQSVPGQGRYVWNYRKPGQWKGKEQGARLSTRTRAMDKLHGYH